MCCGGSQKKGLSRGLPPPTKDAGALNWGGWGQDGEERMDSSIFWRRNFGLNWLDKDKEETRDDTLAFGFDK